MKTEALTFEKTIETSAAQAAETTMKVEALKELAEFELAYVGGGTASVIFA